MSGIWKRAAILIMEIVPILQANKIFNVIGILHFYFTLGRKAAAASCR